MVAALKAEYLQSEVKYLTRNTQLLGKISLWTPDSWDFLRLIQKLKSGKLFCFFHLSKAIL